MGTAVGVIGGHLYVAGGATQAQHAQGGLYDYDIAARTWYTRTPMLQAVYEPASVVISGRLWAIGGTTLSAAQRADAPTGISGVQIYNPQTDSWSWGPPLTGGRSHSGATVIGNQVFVFGGGDGTYSDSLEMTTFHPGVPCPSATVTPTGTATPTVTATVTATPSASATGVPPTTAVPRTRTPAPPPGTPTTSAPPSATPISPPPSATATPCALRFSDVTDPSAYYYAAVYALAGRGVVSGYSDGTFRPFALTTRAQLTKIVTLAFALPLVPPPATATFADMDRSSVFYGLIETAAARGIVSGYTCGGGNPQTGTAEPCDRARRPYFRPSNNVTRGQLTKIVVGGAGWAWHTPAMPTFGDVPADNVFYPAIETAVCHGIISGYSDFTFRPSAAAFRGQIAKISYLEISSAAGCAPARPAP